MSQPSNQSVIKDALEVFSECIKNGNEIQNLCETCSNATVKAHPVVKKLVEKIRDDTAAIERIKAKVESLKKSLDDKNYQKWKSDLSEVVNSLETASNETFTKIAFAMATSGTKNVKKKFEANEMFLAGSDLAGINDETVRRFATMLSERNQKIIDCLKFANSKLPKYFQLEDELQRRSKARRRLYIIAHEITRNSSASKRNEHLGEVTIKQKTPSAIKINAKIQPTEFRQNLNGYLIDDSERTEVMLKLTEPFSDSVNLMDFSQNRSNVLDATKLSATIEINGEIDEDVEIVEIKLTTEENRSKEGPAAIAIVENNMTGDFEKVPIQVVPMSPIQGKIIEIQSENVEIDLIDMDGPLLNSTFRFDSPKNVSHFATPSRRTRDNEKSFRSQYYTPVRSRDKRLPKIRLADRFNQSLQATNDKSAVIDKIVEDTTDKVVDAILNGSSLLDDVSEIDFADMSSFNQSMQNRGIKSFRQPSQQLEDVSEIDFADMSSFNQSMQNQSLRNRSVQNQGNRSFRREPSQQIADVSEIDYADISSVYSPNLSMKNRENTIGSMNNSRKRQESMLENVSEIDFANQSSVYSPNQSLAAREYSFRQNRSINQPEEGILIDIDQTPLKIQRAAPITYGDNLMQFNDSATLNQSRGNENFNELVQELANVLDEGLPSRLQRRQKVHDRSLPYSRKEKSVNKMLNTSLPAKMPMTSKRITFERPIQVVPSRIPEDAPMTTVVVDRQRRSPLRKQEKVRIDRALDQLSNPFANDFRIIPEYAASQSFNESRPGTSYGRNISLPLHLTPRKDPLAPLEQSLMSAYNQFQAEEDDNLENISAPMLATLEDMTDSSEDLEDISNPFSASFNDVMDEYGELQSLPILPASDFMARFADNEDLNQVSFDLIDDESQLFN